MSRAADWADQVKRRPEYAWSSTLHFADSEAWKCSWDLSECPKKDRCVVGAIANYSERLVHFTDHDVQEEALKFLIHFVGDVHQPLHTGFKEDRGGNDIKGLFFGHHDNLHAIWDTYVIKRRIHNDFKAESDYASWLISQVEGKYKDKVDDWASCVTYNCLPSWASESVLLACKFAYSEANGAHISNGFDLSSEYFERTVPIIEEQMVKAGVRLGALLNTLIQAQTS